MMNGKMKWTIQQRFMSEIWQVQSNSYGQAFFTTEEQIYQLFSKCGELKRIIMGLDKFQKTPVFLFLWDSVDFAFVSSIIGVMRLMR